MKDILQFMLRCCFDFWIFLILVVFACLFWLPESTYGAKIMEEKRVLILFSNQSDLPAYPIVERGIKSSL
jgi:hypothetical protein